MVFAMVMFRQDGIMYGYHKNSEAFLLLSFLFFGVFDEKRVVRKLLNGYSVIGILLQTLVQKVSPLFRHIDIRRNRNLILDDFDQLLLFVYFERTFAYQHLVHHYAY